MSIEDLWYKNAIIYCLHVEKYLDANGDGIGDFDGLSRKLAYLSGLGVTCVWLQPFYRSPQRDNGYDVADFFSIDPRYGSFGDFVEFMNCAKALGIRVIADLVVNHTSNMHPWFQSARSDRRSPYRDWYIWSDTRPDNHAEGIVFPGSQHTTWTWDDEAQQFYFHRFYDFQPDLNTHNPAVQEEILKTMGFWLELGVSGFRMDAVPFVIERKGARVEAEQDFEILHRMRDLLQWRRGDAILLAEANVPPEESLKYFGHAGDNLHMMLNFPVNQRLFYAFATGDVGPLVWALEQTRTRPSHSQWVQFLRSHDECDLGRLSENERAEVFKALGPAKESQIYGRGIRRRLAPMLGNDMRRLQLAFSLLFALPGTPMLQYGDEIGMGDDLSLPERECARTAMQWSSERFGGFTPCSQSEVPVIDSEEYGYQRLNVAQQQVDANSLLNWTERLIRLRKECPAISWGDFQLLRLPSAHILALLYEWRQTSMIILHNFSDRSVSVTLPPHCAGPLFDVFGKRHLTAAGPHTVDLEGYGYRWYRVGSADTSLLQGSMGLE